MKIYVAAPYTAASREEVEKNVTRAIDAGIELLKRGHVPFIPHLTHYVELRAQERDIPITYDEYLDWDREWLDLCDALVYLGRSKGVDIEIARADELGIPIFASVEEVEG